MEDFQMDIFQYVGEGDKKKQERARKLDLSEQKRRRKKKTERSML